MARLAVLSGIIPEDKVGDEDEDKGGGVWLPSADSHRLLRRLLRKDLGLSWSGDSVKLGSGSPAPSPPPLPSLVGVVLVVVVVVVVVVCCCTMRDSKEAELEEDDEDVIDLGMESSWEGGM